MDDKELQVLVGKVTPERVRHLAHEIEARQPKVNKGTAPLWEILEAFAIDLPLEDAAARSPVEMRLRAAVIDAVAQIEGMTFVEGDGWWAPDFISLEGRSR
jgi:hypothetical protein